MYYFIDLFCGFGAMTKAFERTGAFKSVLAADIDDNMRVHFDYLFRKKPLGDIFSKETMKAIHITPYDVLCAGINGLNEEAFYKVLEIVEKDIPKAFVLEMDTSVISKSFCKTLKNFCEKHEYHFVGYKDSIDDITLNLENFGVPEFCERVYCVCLKNEWIRCKDDLFLQLNKKHDYECYKYTKYEPEKKPEQRRGIDWGFGGNFRFLDGTPENHKIAIIDEASPIPMTCNVALSLMEWLI